MCAPSCFHWWRALGRAASRRDFVKGALALPLVAAGCATTASAANQAAGRAVLDDVLSVDVHTHPALFQTYSRTTIEEHARAVQADELGDVQTEPAVHNGLTPFGRDVVREMNRLGMLVDLAHAPYPAVKGAMDASSRPMLVSHTNIEDYSGYARFVSREHARLVAGTGGVLGAWPISIRHASASTFIDHIKRMVDAVGVDHVAIGTDMAGVSPRSALFTDWTEWPSIPAALLDRGFARQDVAKIMGGNMRRLLEATVS